LAIEHLREYLHPHLLDIRRRRQQQLLRTVKDIDHAQRCLDIPPQPKQTGTLTAFTDAFFQRRHCTNS
jgi:hypothetical protein